MGTTRRSDGASNHEQRPLESSANIHAAQPKSGGAKVSRVRFGSTAAHPDFERVAVLREKFLVATREIAHVQAQQAKALAEIQEIVLERARQPEEINVSLRSRAAECAVPAGLSDRAVLGMMGDAHQLVFLFPRTYEALAHARVSMQHAKVIVHESSALSDKLLPRYEALCLREAVKTTPGRLRGKAREIAQQLQPRTVDELHEVAAAQRGVWVSPRPDGMAELGAVLPAVLAYGIKDRLDRIAKSTKHRVARQGLDQKDKPTVTPADTRVAPAAIRPSAATAPGYGTKPEPARDALNPRTKLPLNYSRLSSEAQQHARAEAQRVRDAEATWSLDTFRADAFAELLLCGIPPLATGSPTDGIDLRANISILIPAGGTATLDGYGPIDAITARQLAAVAPGWDHTTVELDGTVLSTGRRQPTEPMRRILRIRDQHCRFPGCYVPVDSCEIDHTEEWARGGATEIRNLAHLCPKHHALKHPDLSFEVRWRAVQDAEGVLTWTGPLNEVFTDLPERRFRATSGARRGPPETTTDENGAAKGPDPGYWEQLDADCSHFKRKDE